MDNLSPSNPTIAALLTILKAGWVAGTLDITAAVIQYVVMTGKSGVNVLRFVASGIFGQKALTGGGGMAAWGLLFHFAIAIAFAAFFWLIAPTVRRVLPNPILAGLAYGVLVWVVMNGIVLPLSNAPAISFTPVRALVSMAIIVLAVGLPISLLINR